MVLSMLSVHLSTGCLMASPHWPRTYALSSVVLSVNEDAKSAGLLIKAGKTIVFANCIAELTMSTAAEDQENEVEVLASIYEENFQRKSSSPPYAFEIHLRGHAPEAGISCSLYFRYSKNYPNEAPIFEIRRPEGLTENETSELVMLISDIIQRSLGGIMIFDLVSEVQIKLDEYSDAALERAKHCEMQAAKALSLAEEERSFHGTRVTVESFNEWNKRFLDEVREKRALQEKKAAAQGVVKRLTGKEMFLRDDKFDESDLTFLEAEGGEIVEVDERLFVDIDDVDFDEDEDVDPTVIAT